MALMLPTSINALSRDSYQMDNVPLELAFCSIASANWTSLWAPSNGTALTLDLWQVISHCFCIAIGTLLNGFVVTVLVLQTASLSALNMNWLGVAAANQLGHVVATLELLSICGSFSWAFTAYSTLLGVPYILLLIIYFIGLCDRFIFTNWSWWHMVNVKPYHILVVQVVSTTVCTILVVWIPPWSVAHDSLAKENYVAIITSVLHLVCMLLKTTLFCQTRSSLKYSVAQSVRHRCRLLSVDDHSFYVHRTKKGLRKEEFMASFVFIAGLVPLLTCNLILCSYLIWTTVFNDSSYCYLLQVSRECELWHMTINLLVFIFFSREFHGMIKSVCKQVPRWCLFRNQT